MKKLNISSDILAKKNAVDEVYPFCMLKYMRFALFYKEYSLKKPHSKRRFLSNFPMGGSIFPLVAEFSNGCG